jgi:hypothetical protein
MLARPPSFVCHLVCTPSFCFQYVTVKTTRQVCHLNAVIGDLWRVIRSSWREQRPGIITTGAEEA